MRIPRQATPGDRSAVPGSPGTGGSGVDALQARLEGLVGDVRTVEYWQRLVQARTDLVVAGLLYGAPVPTTAERLVGGAASHDATPPEGEVVGLDRVLADLAPLECSEDGPGAHLERLRRTAARLSERRHHLVAEVDAVSLALRDAVELVAERAGRAAGTSDERADRRVPAIATGDA